MCTVTQEEIKGGECKIENLEVISDCDSNNPYKVIKVHVIYTGDPNVPGFDCVDKTVEIPCSNIVRLPFFTLWNFIAVFVLLMVFYFLSHKKKKALCLKK